MIDIDALIAPVSDEEPAGPDLSYDAARQDIETAFDMSVSDDGASESDTDWRALIAKIVTQAESTRDVWLAVYLMRAGAKAGSLETIEDGANMLAGLFENLWDTVHPQLEEYGFQGRKGPCEALTRLPEFLNPLRTVALIEHQRLGRYSGNDFERFRVNGGSEDGYGMFRALLDETSDEDLSAVVGRVTGISDAIRRADAVMVANADNDTGTNFQPTYAALAEITRSVASFLRTPVEGMEIADDSSGSYGDDDDDSGGASIAGRVNSRKDVMRALDAISDYYSRKEPGSPVPFALRRARDWVSLDFLSVLEDIAPNSLEEARRVLISGRNESGSDSSSSWETDE